MNKFKSVIMDVILIVSCTTLQAGNGSAGWGAFGGALGGSLLGNAISPRSTRTEVVQVPVQQAPAPREDYDDAAVRKLRAKVKDLQASVDDLEDENATLKRKVKKLEAENTRLHERLERHEHHHHETKTVKTTRTATAA